MGSAREVRRARWGPIRWRVWLIGLIVTAGFGLIGVRLVVLHVIKGPDLARRAERQHLRNVPLEGGRGMILDRNGAILAASLDLPSVYALPPQMEDPAATARRLAELLGESPRELAGRLSEHKGFVWLARGVDPRIGREIQRLSLPGVGVVPESQRMYPKRRLLANLIGFAGVDHRGLEGLELRYDPVLRGGKGWLLLDRDGAGRYLLASGIYGTAPERGRNLVLTIDEVIQYIAERELAKAVQASGAASGSVIALEPRTGAIYAMAVYPSFNPNAVSAASPEAWRNRVITDLFEPGSSLKAIVVAAALEEGVIHAGDRFPCLEGAIPVAGGAIRDTHPCAGEISLEDVVRRSSNVGVVQIARRLGPSRLYRYLEDFGFGRSTELGLQGESPGLLRPPSAWSPRSPDSLAIGQEVGVTGLQLARAFAAIANGGWLMRPYVVAEVRDESGNTLARFGPQVLRRVISGETGAATARLLTGVTDPEGTAHRAAIGGYTVAGKTGTAQKIDPRTGRYTGGKVVASFVGFVPAEDPALLVAVVIDEPKGDAWGGTIAAPVFRAIAQDALRYLRVPPDRDTARLRLDPESVRVGAPVAEKAA